ncbi:nucleoside phosphorylase domain-containing protein [Lineolata rhizophorae]|uniref:Purine nucleoside phosphorylase n=1 Tax=Lineolata rhizophorae TaxID=578093 RepID=A0A6A6P016_9PEZI|nr:nucleoside phosphorylase domain-containing protein [Lineolata rhizophorae]
MDDDLTSPSTYKRASETAENILKDLPEQLRAPKVGIVCGSGLGGLAEAIEDEPKVEVPYKGIPNFPQSTVQGHAGKLVFGLIGPAKTPVVLLVGRAHFYEGHSMELVTFATRLCRMLGVEVMIVTNAAGGLNPEYNVGDIVCLNDHLYLAGMVGVNPLRGPNDESIGVRFPPLSDAYDLELRRRAHIAWRKLELDSSRGKLHEGVYAFASGPTYETRAECRMLRGFGADLVGMSTVPEIVVARHSGMRVLAFSLVTNRAVLEPGLRGDDPLVQGMSAGGLAEFLSKGKANHEEVLEEGRKAARDMQGLVKEIVGDLYAN